jgi:DNA repair exonuclease SbcCD ATPase subunit
MYRSFFLALSLLFVPAAGFCQSSSTDSQTLQALLAEVRQLRKDLQTTTAAAQRAQILFYRLQVQEANVARATRRVDEAKTRVAASQNEKRILTAELKRNEDMLNESAASPTDRKQAEDSISRLKTRLEQADGEEQQRQTIQIEAENELQTERLKLTDLQDQLDRLQKTLENMAQQGSSPR